MVFLSWDCDTSETEFSTRPVKSVMKILKFMLKISERNLKGTKL